MSTTTAIKNGAKLAVIVTIIAAVLLTPICVWGYRLLAKRQITGKVLIVQRDANVKKLALIELYAVSDADVAKWKDSVAESLRQAVGEIHRTQKEAASAEAEIREIGEKRVANSLACIERTKEAAEAARKIWLIERKSESLRNRFKELVAKEPIPGNQELTKLMRDDNWQDAYVLLSTSSLPEAERINRLAANDYDKQLQTHLRATRNKLIGMRESLDELIPHPTVNALPASVEIHAKDVTDDSGSFSLNVLPGDYYIFAEGNRDVFSKTEHYFWAHPVKVPSQESEKCLIGNLNLNGESTIKDDLWYELRKTIAEQKKRIQP